jgi:hypothetical protein
MGDFLNRFYRQRWSGGKYCELFCDVCAMPLTMKQWTRSQQAFAIKVFYKNDSYITTQWLFHQHYHLDQHDHVPSAHAIKTWLKNFEGTGSTLKTKPPGKIRTVRTPEKVGRFMTAFHHSPQCSARHHAVSLNISSSSVQRILWKDLQFHPHKIQVLQELKERDFISHTNFCCVFLTHLDDIHNLFMSNEAHFHFSG